MNTTTEATTTETASTGKPSTATGKAGGKGKAVKEVPPVGAYIHDTRKHNRRYLEVLEVGADSVTVRVVAKLDRVVDDPADGEYSFPKGTEGAVRTFPVQPSKKHTIGLALLAAKFVRCPESRVPTVAWVDTIIAERARAQTATTAAAAPTA
ncbi:hypothetical protein ACIGO9_29785 [Nocardia asteroides]|uniref:hypothetical protein n=1 Tax=Nocardia asteroides TaxID=1824 RepID=UPI0037C97149